MSHRTQASEHEHEHDWRVQSMRRNGSWATRPNFPAYWVGRRPSVRAKCEVCGEVTTEPIAPYPERSG